MHFDDRLATVLRMRADGQAVQRIQFRQLLDLLGTLPVEKRGQRIDAAYVRLNELAGQVGAADQAAMAADPGLRLRSPRLVAVLAHGDPSLAAVVLRRADLSEEEWLDLVPALPPTVRVHLRDRADLPERVDRLLSRLGVTSRGLPPAPSMDVDSKAGQAGIAAGAAARQTPAAAPVAVLPAADNDHGAIAILPPIAGDDDKGGIGAIVKRIEAYRRAKQVVENQPAGDSPRLPLGEEHVLHVPAQARAFDFATGTDARIVWADPGVAPMVLGLRLGGEQARGDTALELGLRRYQPIRDCPVGLTGAPSISGDWRLDAVPWFDPLTGRYLGHRGRMRRPAAEQTAPAIAVPKVRDSEADRIRQMLHELRTPVNAIQIGAEIIQQQLYGPVPHEYRALAAGIAGDAARMLSAFEELERLAKLDSQAMALDPGETDLGQVVATTVAQLGEHTRQRGSGFAVQAADGASAVGLARIEVERVVWRLLATLAGVSALGEVLPLTLHQHDTMVRLELTLPAALAAREGDDLFKAAAGAIPQVLAAGVFGVGFALRLARAEAKAAGGSLQREGDRLILTLPGLTTANGNHTDKESVTAPGQ